VEFGKFCKPGLFILLKGKVQKRYKSDSLEFKVSQIELLSEVRKNHIRSFTLNLPLEAINQQIIGELDIVMKRNKGNVMLRFTVFDEDHHIQLFSRNTKISVSNELIRFLEEHPEIAYRIN
jgi:DNA polymerase-3 subunit alpha